MLDKLTVQGQLIIRDVYLLQDRKLLSEYCIYIKDDKGKAKNADLWTAIQENKKERWIQLVEESYKIESHDASKGPFFRIADSTLGKTEITGCDLSGYDFEYRDSKLIEMFISGTLLPATLHIYARYSYSESNRNTQEQKISYYNQLKKISDNQGNIVDAIKYHSKSMEHQEELLKIEFKEQKKLAKWRRIISYLEIKAFQLNHLSNNHGENWVSALTFTIIVSFLFYCIYYPCQFHDQPFSLSGTADFLADFLSFLDPLHRLDFIVKKEDVKPAAKLFDFLGRLFTAYGIYQFIAAFRKHGRKAVKKTFWELLIAAMGSEHADMWDGKNRADMLFFYEQMGVFFRADL